MSVLKQQDAEDELDLYQLLYWSAIFRKHKQVVGKQTCITYKHHKGNYPYDVWYVKDLMCYRIQYSNDPYQAFGNFLEYEKWDLTRWGHWGRENIGLLRLFPEGNPQLDEMDKIALGILHRDPMLLDFATDVLQRG